MYLLPQPKKIEYGEGELLLWHDSYITLSPKAAKTEKYAAERLHDAICAETGLDLIWTAAEARKGDISLDICEELPQQSYHLHIGEDGISIKGGDGAGLLYGVETLCQILKQCAGVLPYVEIEDAPDMPNRGYYFDQTRGRVLKLEELKKLADRMSHYKMNQLQLYVEHTYMFRDFSEMWRDQTPLTAAEIMELDEYCKERHIELVPSLASFGHLWALLSTKTYGEYCEMEDSWKTPFSFWDRMRLHTINVSDDRSLGLIKKMIAEYMQLFSTNKFNICADETFALGKGKSKKLAEEKGVHRLYIDYVKDLAQFLVEQGKEPQFWGDIICGSPELFKELPESMVCLNWGYCYDQREDETIAIAKTGAKQYLCPGVGGWNQWINWVENSFLNITLMCSYAKKHNAIGVLNTDWGDFGHVNEPAFSIPGMIYGGIFAWNGEKIAFEDVNRMISRLEYEDTTESFVANLAEVCKTSVFQWRETVLYYENKVLGHELENNEDLFRNVDAARVQRVAERMPKLYHELMQATAAMHSTEAKKTMQLLSVTMQGIALWNEVGILGQSREREGSFDAQQGVALAEKLEKWFTAFKENWRSTGKEGDLHHIGEIVFWYADWLRGRLA